MNTNLRNKSIQIGMFVGLLAILCILNPNMFTVPYLWAEDGNIFLTNIWENAGGGGASTILKPYAGYLHLIPYGTMYFADLVARLLGDKIIVIPYIARAISMLYASYCVWYFCTDDFSILLPARSLRFIAACMCMTMALLCAEVAYTITNVQWWAGFWFFLFGLNTICNNRFPRSPSCILMLIISGLSTPMIALAFAIVVFQCLREFLQKKTRISIWTGLYLLAAGLPTAIQGVCILRTGGDRISGELVHLLSSVAYAMIATTPGCVTHLFSSEKMNVITLGTILLLVIILRCNRVSLSAYTILYFPAFTGAYWIMTMIGVDSNSILYGSNRYTFIPYLVFIILLFITCLPRGCYELDSTPAFRCKKAFLLLLIFLFSVEAGLQVGRYKWDLHYAGEYTDCSRIYCRGSQEKAFVRTICWGNWGIWIPVSLDDFRAQPELADDAQARVLVADSTEVNGQILLAQNRNDEILQFDIVVPVIDDEPMIVIAEINNEKYICRKANRDHSSTNRYIADIHRDAIHSEEPNRIKILVVCPVSQTYQIARSIDLIMA